MENVPWFVQSTNFRQARDGTPFISGVTVRHFVSREVAESWVAKQPANQWVEHSEPEPVIMWEDK